MVVGAREALAAADQHDRQVPDLGSSLRYPAALQEVLEWLAFSLDEIEGSLYPMGSGVKQSLRQVGYVKASARLALAAVKAMRGLLLEELEAWESSSYTIPNPGQWALSYLQSTGYPEPTEEHLRRMQTEISVLHHLIEEEAPSYGVMALARPSLLSSVTPSGAATPRL